LSGNGKNEARGVSLFLCRHRWFSKSLTGRARILPIFNLPQLECGLEKRPSSRILHVLFFAPVTQTASRSHHHVFQYVTQSCRSSNAKAWFT